MMKLSKLFGCFVIVLSLPHGCDRIYKTHQAISMQVVQASDGEAIEAAHVEAAQKYYEQWHVSEPDEVRNRSWIDQYGQRSSATNSSGHAIIDMELVSMRGGMLPYLLPWFDYKKDRVSEKCYLLRVRADSREEILTGMLSQNKVICGDEFTIKILSIGEASAIK